MHFCAACRWEEVFFKKKQNKGLCSVSERAIGLCWTSCGQTLSQLWPFLPKHFSIIRCELRQGVTGVDLEYVWLRKQIRLVYLSTSCPLPRYTTPLFSAGGHSCVSSVSSPASRQTKVSVLIILSAAHSKTGEDVRNERRRAYHRTDRSWIYSALRRKKPATQLL